MSLLTMRNIHKAFSGVPVLKGVQLTVEQGEIHALLGENGAGKSTLMNILTGTIPYDAGTITFDGRELHHITIHQSEELGIAFVHQELNLFNDLKVYENLFITKEETGWFGMLRKKAMIAKARELFQELHVDIDPEADVSSIKTSDKQLLEISKALFFNAKLLILDEPTTSLNNDEIENLFRIVNSLKEKGVSFIFISHKMPEIFRYCDSYTVFRNGEYIADGRISETTPAEVTRLMVGKAQNASGLYEERETGECVLQLQNYTGAGFRGINLKVHKGEILGMTGLQGCGSTELMQALFGITRPTGGAATVKGRLLRGGSVRESMQAGVGLLASNRKENSVIPDMSLLENMYLAEHTLSSRQFHIRRRVEEQRYQNYRQQLSIKANDSSDPIVSLSGGNQQKIFIARWLNTNADILLFDNPTQGIDVGAKEEIYRLCLRLAQEGKTILINTLEIPELQKVADRCVIFYDGEIIKTLEHDEIDEHTVMMYSTNSYEGVAGHAQ